MSNNFVPVQIDSDFDLPLVQSTLKIFGSLIVTYAVVFKDAALQAKPAL